jgi:hypothetical protein
LWALPPLGGGWKDFLALLQEKTDLIFNTHIVKSPDTMTRSQGHPNTSYSKSLSALGCNRLVFSSGTSALALCLVELDPF